MGKAIVAGIRERGGNVIAKPVKRADADTLTGGRFSQARSNRLH